MAHGGSQPACPEGVGWLGALQVAMAAAKAEGAAWEKRHTQVALIALCSAINYADRVSPHPTPLLTDP